MNRNRVELRSLFVSGFLDFQEMYKTKTEIHPLHNKLDKTFAGNCYR